MSPQQKQQHETISAIDSKVTGIDDKVTDFIKMVIKAGKILVPAFLGLVGGVVWIGYKAISINDWNNSLVKKPQYTQDKIRQAKVDSIQTADIDTIRGKIPIIGFTHVTQHRDKNGNVSERNYD
jgi:hypothetical protein